MLTKRERIEKYLRLTDWARRRYTVDGVLPVLDRGDPTPYTVIERRAAVYYLRVISEQLRYDIRTSAQQRRGVAPC